MIKSIIGLSRGDFLRELKKTGAISNANLRRLENMSPLLIVMAARVMPQCDPANTRYEPLTVLFSDDTCWQVLSALKTQGFLFYEEHESYMIRVFLNRLLSQDYPELADNYGLVMEYESRRQLSAWQKEDFHKILRELLIASEYKALCYRLGLDGNGVRTIADCATELKTSPERAEALYETALAKLTGDTKILRRQFGYFNCRKYIKRAKKVRGELKMIYRWAYVENPFEMAALSAGVARGS